MRERKRSNDINDLRPELQFRKFQGRFGNIDEVGCEVTQPLFGVCQISACGGQPFGGDPTYSLPFPPICKSEVAEQAKPLSTIVFEVLRSLALIFPGLL